MKPPIALRGKLRRRLWWATLPYYGWADHNEEDEACGAIPPPWYALPLAWFHRLVAWTLRNRDVFGPNHNRDHLYVGRPRWKPWQ